MPSKSPAQKKTMSAIAHGWKPPAGSEVAEIPVKVAKEFHQADKAKGKRQFGLADAGRAAAGQPDVKPKKHR
jgi:hypothetical protein